MTVTVQIQAHDMPVSQHLREYVEKKVGRLDHYLSAINEAQVDLSEAKSARSASDRHVAQLTVRMRGVVLRAEESKDDIFAAVDAVLDKMQRQIERYKGKRWHLRHAGAGMADLAQPEEMEELEGPETEPAGRVVRRKEFALMPMNEEEALEQMVLLGHESFFVFYNADSNRVNVVYRRKNGDFGLIDPQIG